MKFTISTKGHYDFIDITDQVRKAVERAKVKNGIAVVFVAGSTVGLTTMEFEKGIQQDLKNTLEKIAPEKQEYEHHKKWGDFNGAAHIKSALLKTDLTIPIENKMLAIGLWQQIVLIDFDEKPREREIIVKIFKEA